MITDKKMMEEELEKLHREVYHFIDSLAIYNDHKAELKMRWQSLDSMTRSAWNFSHRGEED